jgi:hypothetical protein
VRGCVDHMSRVCVNEQNTHADVRTSQLRIARMRTLRVYARVHMVVCVVAHAAWSMMVCNVRAYGYALKTSPSSPSPTFSCNKYFSMLRWSKGHQYTGESSNNEYHAGVAFLMTCFFRVFSFSSATAVVPGGRAPFLLPFL